MKKKILSVILTMAMILSTLSVPMDVFADSLTVQYHTGDYIFDFNDESDVLKTVNGNVDTQSGVLALHNGTGSDAEISATLNYQLKSNSTYSFEIKMTASGVTASNWITPKFFTANSAGSNGSQLFAIPGYGLRPSSVSATIKTGTFTTGELTADNDLLKFYMLVGASQTYTYNIDYIKIYDEYPANTGNYTFDFDNKKKDTLSVTNGYVANGKLVTKDGKAAWNNLTAILNYKLESNKSYVYEITGTVSGYSSGSVQALLTLASKTAADTSSGKLINLYYPDNLSGWAVPSNRSFTFKGKINTNSLSDGNDYLAIYLNDGTDAKFEFEKIKIIEANSGDYVFNFDNADDVLKTVNGNVDTQNGVVALHNGTGNDAEISATLNYQLKSNTKYSYEIKMTASGEASSNWIAPRLYASNLTLNNPRLCAFDGYGLTPSSVSATIRTGTFTTGELMAGVDLLTFYMWVGAAQTYTYNIDYIKIYDETEYPANTGNYTFDFDVKKKDTLSVTNGYVADGKLVTKDGKAPWNNLTAILNYQLESNKTYAYEIIGNVSGYSNTDSLQALLTLSSKTAADTANGKLSNLYYPESLTGWATPKNGDFIFTGTFTTGDLTLENNYLALWLNDGTNAKFEFESIEIIEKQEPSVPSEFADVPIPYLTVGKDQSEVFITWFVNNDDVKGKVIISENGVEKEYVAYEHFASTDSSYYCNRAKITGLKANTNYKYRVGTEENWSKEYSLNTKDFDDSFSFIQVSDVQLPGSSSYLNNWNTTLSRINEYFPDNSFILNTGDIADDPKNNSHYLLYKSPDLLKNYITSVVPGNHDHDPSGNNFYNQHFTSPETYDAYDGYGINQCDYWYSYNNVLFLSLNTNIKDTIYHKSFVSKVIKEQEDKFDWVIVNCHHSLFGASYHSKESDVISFRNELAPLFSELKVDMVLSGHDHCYDRSYIMNATSPVVSNKSFAYNTNGGVLYVSATTSSALKFNEPEDGSEGYSAKIIESQYGFINYSVRDGAITLTYYSSSDMSVLDKFTVYKVNSTHLVDLRKDLLNGDIDEAIDYNDDGESNILDLVRLKKMLVNVA